MSISIDTKTGQITQTGVTGKTTTAATPAASAAVGQQDFLTLMLAQMKNQDPLQPTQNGEFLAQLAQFSTVSGIDKVNSTLTSFGAGMQDFRIGSAANLLGRQVLVSGNVTRPDATGGVHGAVDLAEDASKLVVSYYDGKTGALLKQTDMGAQPAGQVAFDWTDVPAELTASHAAVRVAATATTPSGTRDVATQVYARVMSAQAAANGGDMTLNVEDYGALNALEAEAFR